MATVGVTLSAVSNTARSGLNAVMPAVDAEPYGSDMITSSGSSQQAAVTAPADADGMFWTITASGGNVWVAFGADPTAVAGTHWLIADGTTRDFGAKANQKVAVIDAA